MARLTHEANALRGEKESLEQHCQELQRVIIDLKQELASDNMSINQLKEDLCHQHAAKAAVDELAEWGGAPSMDCRELALLWEQDFLVLLADAQGKEVFQAGVVCFPSSWRPEEKVGLPIYAIHSPVPTLNERLGEQIDKFIAGIKPDTVWERVNWGLSRSAELNQHPDCEIPRLEPPFNLNQVWVRREDQVLFRLPKTRALIFGINVFNISVGEVASDKEGRAGLRRAIETMPEEIAEYKNLLKSREYLLALLDA